ncbi:MAG: protein-disulfide reductase DsbD domain-containing protein, partial [Pseudomonadota bacterium]
MRHRAFLWLILLCLLAVAPAPAEEQFLKPDEAFRISARHEAGNLLITWKIAEGYYLYRSKFRFHAEPEGVEFGVARYPETLTKHDEFFGDVEVYRDEFTVELPIRATGGADILTLEATSQGCADAGLCFPPHRQKLLVAVPASTPVDEIEAPAELPPKAADDAVSAVLGTGTAAAPQSSPASPGTATRDLQTFADDLGLGDLDDDILPAEEAFRFSADTLDPDSLRLQWHIAEGTYLYSDKLKIELMGEGVALGEFQLPKPKIKHDTVTPDGEIGDVSVYVGDIDLTVPLLRSRADPTEVELIARYQGCADRGICYPPQTARVSLSLPATTQIAAIIPVDSGPDAGDRPGQDAAAATAATEPVAEQDQIAGLLEGSGTWVILGTFFLIGLGLAFTPCVFPMIPILSGIITGQGSSITAGKAFSLSLVYVLAMAVTYTAAGVIAALSGENLQAALQNPVALTIFAAVFVALALSMFGFYDLQLPSSWQSRLSEISNRQHGGTLAGAGVMGFLSALIVGPCVAP